MDNPYTLHCFLPGHTIDAIIKLKGRHNYTKEEMVVLRERFDALNGKIVVKAGMTLKIPIESSPADAAHPSVPAES